MYGEPTIEQKREMTPKDGTWSCKYRMIGPDRNSEQDALKDLDAYNQNLKLRKEIETLRKQITAARSSLQVALAEQ